MSRQSPVPAPSNAEPWPGTLSLAVVSSGGGLGLAGAPNASLRINAKLTWARGLWRRVLRPPMPLGPGDCDVVDPWTAAAPHPHRGPVGPCPSCVLHAPPLQAVKNVPEEHAKKLYLMYAKAEEDYGLAKTAMAIYDRAVKAVKVLPPPHAPFPAPSSALASSLPPPLPPSLPPSSLSLSLPLSLSLSLSLGGTWLRIAAVGSTERDGAPEQLQAEFGGN